MTLSRKYAKVANNFFSRVVKYDTIKYFTGFVIFFFYRERHFYSKMALPHATNNIIYHYHSYRLPPNFTKMSLKNKRTATEEGMN